MQPYKYVPGYYGNCNRQNHLSCVSLAFSQTYKSLRTGNQNTNLYNKIKIYFRLCRDTDFNPCSHSPVPTKGSKTTEFGFTCPILAMMKPRVASMLVLPESQDHKQNRMTNKTGQDDKQDRSGWQTRQVRMANKTGQDGKQDRSGWQTRQVRMANKTGQDGKQDRSG